MLLPGLLFCVLFMKARNGEVLYSRLGEPSAKHVFSGFEEVSDELEKESY